VRSRAPGGTMHRCRKPAQKGNIAMTDQRLIEVESKLAYTEDALQVLNEVVARQQQQIDRLQAICQHLLERARSNADNSFVGRPEDEVPPHY